MEPEKLKATACTYVRNADDKHAVYITGGRIIVYMTIAEARELSLELQRAADDAELKLKN